MTRRVLVLLVLLFGCQASVAELTAEEMATSFLQPGAQLPGAKDGPMNWSVKILDRHWCKPARMVMRSSYGLDMPPAVLGEAGMVCRGCYRSTHLSSLAVFCPRNHQGGMKCVYPYAADYDEWGLSANDCVPAIHLHEGLLMATEEEHGN